MRHSSIWALQKGSPLVLTGKRKAIVIQVLESPSQAMSGKFLVRLDSDKSELVVTAKDIVSTRRPRKLRF